MSQAPPSLSKIVKQHTAEQHSQREANDAHRRAALAAATPASRALVDAMNHEVAGVFLAQRELDAEVRRLQANTARFAKHTAQWVGLLDGFSASLRAVGDVEAWAAAIDTDLTVVSNGLDILASSSS